MPTVISTFAGCGGSSLGYKWAGFRELLAIEWETNAVETFKLNFPEVPVWQRDIKTVTAREIFDFTGIKKGELDVFDGSPPCQGFSTAGKRKVNDSRNDLFKEYSRLIKELQPKVFIMENVSGMIKGKMRGKFLEILSELKSCGYNVKCKLMNAMWYDVPQSRERLFFIGVRNDLNVEPSFPEPSNKVTNSNIVKGSPTDGLNGKFLLLTGKTSELIKELKQGERLSDVYERKNKGKHAYFAFGRLDLNKPARTIIKNSAGLIHWFENRTLTIGEYKRIASFPDEYKFIGTFSDALQRIGNAVMPKMMYHIAKHIKDNCLSTMERK